MDDFKDIYLGRMLKKWVTVYPLPEYGRAGLLWVASHPAIQHKPDYLQWSKFQPLRLTNHGAIDLSYMLFSWATLSPFKVPL